MKRLLSSCVISIALLATTAFAEDINEIFSKVNGYVKSENYTKAMSELDWAKKELESMHMKKLQAFFPDSMAGLQGQKFEANAVLGMTNIERNYAGDSANVKVSLTGGSAGGSNNPFGAFAQIGQMAAMMQNGDPNSETFRINGRTATLTKNQNAGGELTVILESGSMLKFETQNKAQSDKLKELAEGINIEALDSYLKG